MPYKLKNGIYAVRCRYPRCTFHSQFEIKQNIMGMTEKDVEIEAKRIARDMALNAIAVIDTERGIVSGRRRC
jgi:hypothetical protein